MIEKIQIEPSWYAQLQAEFQKPYFEQLVAFVKTEYAQYPCFPKGNEIFSAFEHTPFDAVKVVILGQDPYHNFNQAHGLCFSVREGIPLPPSLKNILKELGADTGVVRTSGDLTDWAKQGVLLLNATLTVRAHEAGSHQKKGWETFTDTVIQKISDEKENVIFVLWGSYAQQKKSLIDTQKHYLIESPHPSPLSAHRGFFGSKPFSQINQYLTEHGAGGISF